MSRETLLDCYVWTGLVGRDGDRYRLPDDSTTEGSEEDRSTLNVGLELPVDLDPDAVEGLVTALRKGLAADQQDPDPPALAADLRVDDGGVHLDAEPEGESE